MPFPDDVFASAEQAALNLIERRKFVRGGAQKWINDCDAGSVNVNNFMHQAMNAFRDSVALWNTWRLFAGVAAALREILPGRWADDAAVNTSLQTAQTGLETAMTDIIAQIPQDASNYVLTLKIVNGAFEERIVTNGAALASLRAVLVALQDSFTG